MFDLSLALKLTEFVSIKTVTIVGDKSNIEDLYLENFIWKTLVDSVSPSGLFNTDNIVLVTWHI